MRITTCFNFFQFHCKLLKRRVNSYKLKDRNNQTSSHQLLTIICTMQLGIKFTLKFAICISKREATKCFLNPTTRPLTSSRRSTDAREDAWLQCIMSQIHSTD